jgi:hypothetical protein
VKARRFIGSDGQLTEDGLALVYGQENLARDGRLADIEVFVGRRTSSDPEVRRAQVDADYRDAARKFGSLPSARSRRDEYVEAKLARAEEMLATWYSSPVDIESARSEDDQPAPAPDD